MLQKSVQVNRKILATPTVQARYVIGLLSHMIVQACYVIGILSHMTVQARYVIGLLSHMTVQVRYRRLMGDNETFVEGGIDTDRQRYPHCIVWTPLPLISYVLCGHHSL